MPLTLPEAQAVIAALFRRDGGELRRTVLGALAVSGGMAPTRRMRGSRACCSPSARLSHDPGDLQLAFRRRRHQGQISLVGEQAGVVDRGQTADLAGLVQFDAGVAAAHRAGDGAGPPLVAAAQAAALDVGNP